VNCRSNCGACCIAPSIRQPYWGMPAGKPAGVACAHLRGDASCGLFGDPRRPDVCKHFEPHPSVCGTHRADAMALLVALEHQTAP
jgi:Fe-S-cluster containining protein